MESTTNSNKSSSTRNEKGKERNVNISQLSNNMKYQIALQNLLAQTCLVNYLRIDKNISHNDCIEKLKNKMIEEEN